jgi:cyclophilin family peptidyl-prolyl cis-trans isomerase
VVRDIAVAGIVLAALVGAGRAQSARTLTDRDYITGTPQGVAILAAEDSRAATPEQLAVLLEGTRSAVPELKLAAVRALGRLERRDLVSSLLPFLRDASASVRSTAAHAIGQAMTGAPLEGDAGAQQVDALLSMLVGSVRGEASPAVAAALASTLARLPYERSIQVQQAESMLVLLLSLSSELSVERSSVPSQTTAMVGAADAFESLGRRQRTLFTPSDRTRTLLRGLASGGGTTIGSAEAMRATRLPAFRAVVSGRMLDADTLRPNLSYEGNDQLRRLAMLSLSGAGSPIPADERIPLLRAGLNDRSSFVRLEAVRGFARHAVKSEGCLPLTGMLSDPSEHVVLTVIDALGDACAEDEQVVMRLVGEARTPPNQGSWRRESHALVALAKRSPDHLEIPLLTHSRHNRWQVRMYAARAAAIAGDEETLVRLALDDDDNVREATLAALKKLKGQEAEAAFAAALARSDYQLLRTAARELAGLRPAPALTSGLLDGLARVTAQRRETSRDTRLALLDRLREFGNQSHLERLRPLLRDFDEKVAAAAAAVMSVWSGQPYAIDPQPLPLESLPLPSELKLTGESVAVLLLESGREIAIQLDPVTAPVTSGRFLRLAKKNYFDGLTFHRIVSNFIVQGGSPGANEYMGDGPYLRDEISAISHDRGTVGLSTRGRDTGDAQFFINLVDNPRLDFDYTVFGRVHPRHLELVDGILEGDRIKDVWFENAKSVR